MPPSFLKPVFPFLQITKLWAWTASQSDTSRQSTACRNPFLLYAALLVSPIRVVRKNFSVSFHQPPNPAPIPQRQLCLIGFSESCPPDEALGTNMLESWAKTPVGHFSSQPMLLQDHFLPQKEEMWLTSGQNWLLSGPRKTVSDLSWEIWGCAQESILVSSFCC